MTEQRIPIETPKGTFNVWTKRVGDNPTMKLLLLHGGPGATAEYFECCDDYLPQAGIEYIYYDQLGSHRSDNPGDPDLVDLPRYVDEVEQVRKALGLTKENFFLLGHSWGGILAMEYALAHPDALKGLIISNMMSSAPAYDAYAKNVLMPTIDQDVLAEVKALEDADDYENPRYMELLIPNHYEHHVLRMPFLDWPEPVTRSFSHINPDVYVPMQGPSELGIRGKLADWDRSGDIHTIATPTLVIGARHDTMDPSHMEWMANELPNGTYLFCPDGSHMAMYDDQEVYFRGVIDFIRGT